MTKIEHLAYEWKRLAEVKDILLNARVKVSEIQGSRVNRGGDSEFVRLLWNGLHEAGVKIVELEKSTSDELDAEFKESFK